MLQAIDLSPNATPSDCAKALADAWPAGLVFHLRGVRPPADLRDFYGEMVDAVGDAAGLAENAMLGDREHQRTSEVWFEVRYDPSVPGAYRHSSDAQPLHTDGSYIPSFPNAGLLACVAQTSDGGETVFLDGATLVDILERNAPDLLQQLRSVPVPHHRSGDRRTAPVLREEDGEFVLNWNYFCVDDACGPDVMELRQRFFDFLDQDHEVAANVVPVKLSPGEAVIWKDDRVLHGRNRFNPRQVSERFFWKAAIDVRPEKLSGAAKRPAHAARP
jgi:alpha-ketoglutarate-dependent taurine dioxygenase